MIYKICRVCVRSRRVKRGGTTRLAGVREGGAQQPMCPARTHVDAPARPARRPRAVRSSANTKHARTRGEATTDRGVGVTFRLRALPIGEHQLLALSHSVGTAHPARRPDGPSRHLASGRQINAPLCAFDASSRATRNARDAATTLPGETLTRSSKKSLSPSSESVLLGLRSSYHQVASAEPAASFRKSPPTQSRQWVEDVGAAVDGAHLDDEGGVDEAVRAEGLRRWWPRTGARR